MQIHGNSQKLLSAATCKLCTLFAHGRLAPVNWIAPDERESRWVLVRQGNIPEIICAKLFILLIGRTETSFTFYLVSPLLEASS